MAPKTHTKSAPMQSSVEAPGLGRLVGIAAAIICTAVFVIVGGALVATGTEPWSAAGIAFFATVFGGGGFAAMIGGVLYATKIENEAIAARVPVTR